MVVVAGDDEDGDATAVAVVLVNGEEDGEVRCVEGVAKVVSAFGGGGGTGRGEDGGGGLSARTPASCRSVATSISCWMRLVM